MTSFASGYSYSKCIQYAGKEADAVNMDYDVKYSQQLQAIKENYAIFGMPYNGTDNADYVDGEVFIEERNNIWNTPYLFNAKEFEEETGLYYYGARYYDPRLSLWISTDALKEKTPNISPYVYTENSPITYIDPDGNFKWKALAEASRSWYNLWHNNKASEVIENRDTKNPYLRIPIRSVLMKMENLS